MKSAEKVRQQQRRSVIIVVIALMGLYLLLPQLKSFQTAIATVVHADWAYVVLACLFFAATYFAAALTYCLIAYFKLPYWPTLLVQIADGFTNRIAPAGIGAIATNVLYLIKQSKSGVKAGYVVGLNNFVGFIAHLIILFILLLISRQTPHQLIHLRAAWFGWLLLAVTLATLLSAALFRQRLRRASVKGYHYLTSVIRASLKHPSRLLAGLLSAMLVTSFYGLTLFSVTLALNVHLSILEVFLALSVSVLAMVITPTPGGLGGVEAGLVAALISFGVASGPALSVALVYRLVTYWLPIVPGVIALQLAVGKGYLSKTKPN